jgi:tetratricopeptide (TPR) repeat protein
MAFTFVGDCVHAREVLDQALLEDPADADALVNAGVIALLQDRPDLARQYWQRMIDADPNSVVARELMAESLILEALQDTYFEPTYFMEAEGLYQEITSLDPANIFAYEGRGSLMQLRADGLLIDSTALAAGDELAVAKSQRSWPLDSARVQEAASIYGDAIDAYRIVASELDPNSPVAAVDVAEAYVARQQLLYSSVVGSVLSGETNPDQAALGEQILGDAEQIHRWTQAVFDSPNASRLDRLRAWAALTESLDREWGWFAFIEQDEDHAAKLEREYRAAVDSAVAFIEKGAIESVDEFLPIRIVYFKANFITGQLDGDPAAASEYMDRIQDLGMQESQLRSEGITHYTTFCTEKRKQQEATTLLQGADLEGAREHYEAALEANPEHLESLLGYGRLLWQSGDIEGATEQATMATRLASERPEGWIELAVYRLGAGDTSGSAEAVEQLGSSLESQPAQEQMHVVGTLIQQLQSLLDDQPALAADIAHIVNPIAGILDAMPSEQHPSYQYPALLRELGTLSLYADAPAEAEPLFRRSIQLDPHTPATHARLVVSLVAQNKDATLEIDASLDEINGAYWDSVYGYEDVAVRRKMMLDEVSRYVEAFPDREAIVEPFVSAIEREGENVPPTGDVGMGAVFTGAPQGYATF